MHIKKVLLVSIFFIFMFLPFANGNLISNGGFELTQNNNLDFCCNGVLGCGASSAPVRQPLYFNDTEYGNHIRSITTYTKSGDYALMIYTHKPSNCTMWSGGSCTQVNITNGGLATYDTPIELQNNSFRINFDVRKCNTTEEPVKCSGFFQDQDTYMSGTNSGRFVVSIDANNGTHSEANSFFGTAQNFYQTFNLDYTAFSFSNVSFPANITLDIGSAVLSYWGDESSCVVYDDLEVSYSEGADDLVTFEDLSEVDDYISDMVSMRGFTYSETHNGNGMSFSSSDFNISNGFDGIPLARLEAVWTKGGGFCGTYPKYYNPDHATIHYKDGTSEDIRNLARVEHNCAGGNTWTLHFNFSIPDYENVKNITLADEIGVSGVGDFTPNITIDPQEEYFYLRNEYENELSTSTFQTTYGLPHLYPVILYNASATNTSVAFTAYNFMNRTEDASDNILIYQYNENDQLTDLTTHSLTFPQGVSHHNVTALYEPDDSDHVTIFFFTELTSFGFNSSLDFEFGEGVNIIFCEDYCDTNYNFYDGYINEYGLCRYEVFSNSTSCYPPGEPEAEAESEGLDATAEATSNLLGINAEAGKLFVALILVMIFSAFGTAIIGRGVKLEGSGFALSFFVQFLAWFLVFTLAGFVPSWITIVLMVLSTFIIGLWFKKGIGGG